jgi:hypothetical protein
MKNDKSVAMFTEKVKKIAVLLEAPLTTANNKIFYKIVPEKVAKIFKLPKFDVLPFSVSQTQRKIYREEHNILNVLKMTDVQTIGKQLGADYVLFLIISNNIPRNAQKILSTNLIITITCDIRLMNVTTGEYTFADQVVKDGSGWAFLNIHPSFYDTYSDALNKTLDELSIIDTSKL